MMLVRSSSTSRPLFEATNLLEADPLPIPPQAHNASGNRDDEDEFEQERLTRPAWVRLESPPPPIDEPSNLEDEMMAVTGQEQNGAAVFVSTGILDFDDYQQRADADSPAGVYTLQHSNFSC